MLMVLIFAVKLGWLPPSGIMEALYPDIIIGGIGKTVLIGIVLFIMVSFMNLLVIRQKIAVIWERKD